MTRRFHRLQLAVLLLVMIALAIWTISEERAAQHARDDANAKAAVLHRLCSGTKMAMDADEAAFRGNDAARREAAYRQFYEGDALYHSSASIQYCINVLPPLSMDCWLNKNWTCLADLAHQIRNAIP